VVRKLLVKRVLLFICLVNILLLKTDLVIIEVTEATADTLKEIPVTGNDLPGNFIASSPVQILSNEELLAGGFPGSGTASDPVIISHLLINQSSTHLIDIRNTDLHLKIEHNQLNGMDGMDDFHGVNLDSVSNVAVTNNSIQSTDRAINAYASTNLSIIENRISNTQRGIYVSSSTTIRKKSLLIDSNDLNDISAGIAIYVIEMEEVTVSSNTVTSSPSTGIHVNAINVVIDSNTLIGNWPGVEAGGINVTVTRNYFHQNYRGGIQVMSSSRNVNILNNTIIGHTSYGIEIMQRTREVSILHNDIIGNTNGLKIIGSMEVTVSWNDFINNSNTQIPDAADKPQIFEHYMSGSSSNSINFNYYSDWTTDSDGDGFTDSTYLVGGNTNNSDGFPLAHPNPARSFKCLEPEFLITTDSIEVHGAVEIGWKPARASIDCGINYGLLYSFNNSSTWELFVSGLKRQVYNWNTSDLAPGNYTVKIRTSFNHGGNITTIETISGTVYRRVVLITDQSESIPWTGDELRDNIYLLVQVAFVILTITVIPGLGILVNSIRKRLYEKAERDFYLKTSGQVMDHSMDGVAFDEYLDRILPSDDSDK